MLHLFQEYWHIVATPRAARGVEAAAGRSGVRPRLGRCGRPAFAARATGSPSRRLTPTPAAARPEICLLTGLCFFAKRAMLDIVSNYLSVRWTYEAHSPHGSAARVENPMRQDRKDLRVLS